jgi:hypothetical protein
VRASKGLDFSCRQARTEGGGGNVMGHTNTTAIVIKPKEEKDPEARRFSEVNSYPQGLTVSFINRGMAYPAPTGRELAIEALLDREPHGDAYRVSRVLVSLSRLA